MQHLIKKSIFFLSLYMAMHFASFCQNTPTTYAPVSFKGGPEYKDDWASFTVKVMGENEQGIFSLRYNFGTTTFYLEKHDKEMNKIFSIKIESINGQQGDISFNADEFDVHDALLLKDKIYVFGSTYDSKKNLNRMYGITYSLSGELGKEKAEICTIASENKANIGLFNVAISQDSSKISILKVEKFSMEKNERFGIYVIDKNFKRIWSKDMELPYRDYKSNIVQTRVDNEGNSHLAAKVWLEDKDKKKGEPDYFYEVFSYYYKQDLKKTHEINLGDTYVSSIDLRVDDKNNLRGAGFYSEKKESKIKGFFSFSINSSSQVLEMSSKQDFDAKFISQFIIPSATLDKATSAQDFSYLFQHAKDLSNFEVRNLIMREDGGMVLIAEYYTDGIYGFYAATEKSNGTLSLNDIIVINLNPDGSTAWAKKIGKKQFVLSPGPWYTLYYNRKSAFMGVTSFNKGKDIHIIFNDSPSNLKNTPDPSKIVVMSSDIVPITTLVSISVDGTVTKTALFPEKEKATVIVPTFTKQLSSNTLLLYGEKGTKYRFVKLKFE